MAMGLNHRVRDVAGGHENGIPSPSGFPGRKTIGRLF
jgi:hypothetical protein